jgi:hypothetical protein
VREFIRGVVESLATLRPSPQLVTIASALPSERVSHDYTADLPLGDGHRAASDRCVKRRFSIDPLALGGFEAIGGQSSTGADTMA